MPWKTVVFVKAYQYWPFQSCGELMGCVQGRGLGESARLAFWGLSCWEPSTCLSRFILLRSFPSSSEVAFRSLSCWEGSPRLPGFILLGSFTSLSPSEVYAAGELHLASSSGVYPSGGPHLAFRGLSCWGASSHLPRIILLGNFTLPSEVYPAGNLQWHFTCGFDFRHGLWLPFVAAFAVLKGLKVLVRAMFWLNMNFFKEQYITTLVENIFTWEQITFSSVCKSF